MATLVFVHAHPDDEASQTSGTMARAVAEGHRVVLVYATNGDHGEVPPDLREGETVIERRRAEADCSAEVIGTHRLVWLGYADSGMTGWDQNLHEASLMQAQVEDVAMLLAEVLREEEADLVIGYDWHGGYGHPDHVKVHHATRRAAELAGTPRYLEGTMNRDAIRRLYETAVASGRGEQVWDPGKPQDDGNPLGTPEAELHWAVDVTRWLEVKRRALACHASQLSDVGMMLAMPAEVFTTLFGVEHYIEPERPAGMLTGWFLDH